LEVCARRQTIISIRSKAAYNKSITAIGIGRKSNKQQELFIIPTLWELTLALIEGKRRTTLEFRL